MVDSNTSVKAIIVEDTPADRPNDLQNDDIQLGEDNDCQAISYYIQNCGLVCMDSFNAHNYRINNCGNRNYRRTTVIGRNDELPYAQPEEGFNGPIPSMGSDLRSFPTNPLQPVTQAPVQNAVPKEIASSNPSETNYQPRLGPTTTLQPVLPSDSSPSDDRHHSLTHLQQCQDSSLANVVIIQLSGNTLADLLTPPAYDALKARIASDVSISGTKRIVGEPPTHSLTSTLVVPSLSRRHISIPVHCVVFSSASLVVLSWLAFFIMANGC